MYCGPHCGHRPPTPVFLGGRPLTSHENKSRKVRLWLGELLFCTRRKISCCVFHLFWEKMHAISYSLFHWSEREISVAVLSLPSRRRRPGFMKTPRLRTRSSRRSLRSLLERRFFSGVHDEACAARGLRGATRSSACCSRSTSRPRLSASASGGTTSSTRSASG